MYFILWSPDRDFISKASSVARKAQPVRRVQVGLRVPAFCAPCSNFSTSVPSAWLLIAFLMQGTIKLSLRRHVGSGTRVSLFLLVSMKRKTAFIDAASFIQEMIAHILMLFLESLVLGAGWWCDWNSFCPYSFQASCKCPPRSTLHVSIFASIFAYHWSISMVVSCMASFSLNHRIAIPDSFSCSQRSPERATVPTMSTSIAVKLRFGLWVVSQRYMVLVLVIPLCMLMLGRLAIHTPSMLSPTLTLFQVRQIWLPRSPDTMEVGSSILIIWSLRGLI